MKKASDYIKSKLKTLPASPGVYLFSNEKMKVIYVGKAASLKDRVRSYFTGRNEWARPIDFALDQIVDLEIRRADSVLEAYFLEQDLIKRLQPKYNVMGKDDKSFVYVCVTKDDFPRFEIKRKTDLVESRKSNVKSQNFKSKLKSEVTSYSHVYGPFTARHLIEAALKILRKMFPYHSKPQKTEKGCLDYHIGLCPGPYDGKISKAEYRKNIRSIELIFKGKKKELIRRIERDMQRHARKQEYEQAAKARNLLFTLRHIRDVALISDRNENFQFPISNLPRRQAGNQTDPKLKIKNDKKNLPATTYQLQATKFFRIEGYDISNISGSHTVGSMVVFDNHDGQMKPNKNEYRRFRIKTIKGANDVAAMQEMLRRRLSNSWRIPNLILLDGGAGHLNMARSVLRDFRYDIPILAVAKGPKRIKLDLRTYGNVPVIANELITFIRDEAHRFAITYHRNVRKKSLLGGEA